MNVVEAAEDQIKSRRQWLEDAYNAMALVESLPNGIEDLEGTLDIANKFGKLVLHGGDIAVAACRAAGAELDKPKMSSYSSSFSVSGRMKVAEYDVDITIYNLEVPANCRVEKYQETVTRFRAVCEEE